MKVVHIVNSLLGGGIQNFLLSLLPEQVKLKNDVTLIVLDKYSTNYSVNLEEKLKNNGVQVYCLNKIVSNKKSTLKTIFLCRKLIKSLNPDIINTHGTLCHFYGAISVWASNIKHCITVHNTPEKWNFLVRILNAKKPIIFCSESAYQHRIQKNKDVIVIDNGISEQIIKSNHVINIRHELGLSPQDKIIVLVGSLRPQKNYDFLKEIVNELHDNHIHFLVCGGNYGKGYISTESFKLYPTIHFLGLRSDVSSIENGANAFLSCAKFEGLPIAVLEAFFNGIPCVLSPIPQHKNIVNNIHSCIIPSDFSAPAFVKAINEILSVKDAHNEIFLYRKPFLEKYSISFTARQYLDFYKKIY